MSPFDLIALKQKVGVEYANEVALYILCHFDAAKRGLCGVPGFNFISLHLVQAQYIFVRLKMQSALAIIQRAGEAWGKASARPGDKASLTTTEYTAMRAGRRAYLLALPRVEAGLYAQAHEAATKIMEKQG